MIEKKKKRKPVKFSPSIRKHSKIKIKELLDIIEIKNNEIEQLKQSLKNSKGVTNGSL